MLAQRAGLLLASLLFVLCSFGQTGFSERGAAGCGTDGAMKAIYSKSPGMFERNLQLERKLLLEHRSLQRVLRSQSVVTLPVVVHIIHNNGPENISNARVLTAIQHLNEAFANTGYYDPADGVDTKIQFCLAQRDPDNNASNGITRDLSPYTNMGGPDYYSDDQQVKNINRWNPNCYINIWIVNSIPGAVAGYAYMPSAHGTLADGIIIEANFFGSGPAFDVVGIHEMGHYLGLYHTFEGGCTNADCQADGDKVCDTPPDNSTASTSCGMAVNSCTSDAQSGFSTDQNDLTSDYMDYGNWSCMTVFTQGQADRMNWMINNVRNSLLQCRSCLSPCPNPVTATFTSSATAVSVGGSVAFTNTSANNVTNRWYVNNTLLATTPNFSNTFSTEGAYRVRLVTIGNNTSLCDSASSEVVITVSCPVAANFTVPSVEVPVGFTLNFLNTSTGSAASYAWLVNNAPEATTQNFSYTFATPGIYTITLKAETSLCASSRTVTINVSTPCDPNGLFIKMLASPQLNFAPHQTLVAADSSILVLGATSFANFSGPDGMTIMRLSKNGNFIWARRYRSTYFLVPQRIVQTADGNFVVLGAYRLGSLNARPFLMKMDGSGNILWQKGYYDAAINNFYFFSFGALTETATGDLVAGFTFDRSNLEGSKTYLARFNASGTLLWSKQANGIELVRDLAAKNNSVYATFFSYVTSPGFSMPQHVAKIDLGSGALVFAKKYDVLPQPAEFPILKFLKLRIVNDRLKIYGSISSGGGIGDTGSHVFATLDTFGTIESFKRMRFTDPFLSITANLPAYFRDGAILKNGEFASIETGDGSWGSLTQKAYIHGTDPGNGPGATRQVLNDIKSNLHFSPFLINNKDNLLDRGGGNMILTGWGTTTVGTTAIGGLFVHSSDYSGIVSANCPTTPGPYSYLPNIISTSNTSELTLANITLTTDPALTLLDSSVQFDTYNLCSQNTGASCFRLRVLAADTLCGLQDSVSIVCRRNTGCTEAVAWTLPASLQNAFRQVNDTLIKVKFPSYGSFTVSAAFASCSSISDTARIFIGKPASLLDLGPDRTICNFSSALINAGAGFRSYRWQNGAVDSVLTADAPGRYFVTVTDYCSNSRTDTIRLTSMPAPAFDIGRDTAICQNDTLSLGATPGFTNVIWSPRYHINQATGQTVSIWPATDTVYTATATYNSSCTVIDSIRIAVRPVPRINLGRDTSICNGDSIFINAGPGFASYAWNTGATTPGISVRAAGTYQVSAQTANGCIARDTFRVPALYPKPAFNLGADTSICRNTVLPLTAGPGFADHIWQDNTRTPVFYASTPGLYWLKVTDANNCTASDSIRILSLLDTPARFIDPMIEACQFNGSFVKANGTFRKYLWSTGSTADSILIVQPGSYWLEVAGGPGCSGRESFVVSLKKCMEGIYFPNAFTPNDDGRNNLFKALVYEDLQTFSLIIYNRYGQPVFETTDPARGWDGRFQGQKQDTGVYVWTCNYRPRSKASVSMKGTVLLLR